MSSDPFIISLFLIFSISSVLVFFIIALLKHRLAMSKIKLEIELRRIKDGGFQSSAKSYAVKFKESEMLLNNVKASMMSDYKVKMDNRVVAIQMLFTYEEYLMIADAVMKSVTSGSKDVSTAESSIAIYKKLNTLISATSVAKPRYVEVADEFRPVLIDHQLKLAQAELEAWNGAPKS